MIKPFVMTLLALAPLFLDSAQAREVKGRQAQSLYEALRRTGMEPDNYAGGSALAVGAVRCRNSRHSQGDDRYVCEIADVAPGADGAEAPAADDGNSLVDRLQDGAGRVENLLARGETREARQALGQYEKDLALFRKRNAGNGGDFDETLRGLQRYLVCEETQPSASSAAATAEKAREFVLYALKVKDPRRLSQYVDCGAGLGLGESEFDRPHSRMALAQRFMEWREGNIAVVGAGEPLVVTGFKGKARARMSFRQHPKTSHWYLWTVTFERP